MGALVQPFLRQYITDRVEVVDDCWLWKLSVGSHGYPQGSIPAITGKRVSLAHRADNARRRARLAA